MDNGPPPPSSSSSVELLEDNSAQTIVSVEAAGRNNNKRNDGTRVDAQTMMGMQWPLLVIGLCFAAVSAILQALQITGPLPLKSQMVCMALVIFFTCVLASISLRSNYKTASDVLLYVAAFLGATTSVGAVVINMNTPLMVASLAIFLSGIFIVIIAYVYKATS